MRSPPQFPDINTAQDWPFRAPLLPHPVRALPPSSPAAGGVAGDGRVRGEPAGTAADVTYVSDAVTGLYVTALFLFHLWSIERRKLYSVPPLPCSGSCESLAISKLGLPGHRSMPTPGHRGAAHSFHYSPS
jgi:hypothetical protein